ncbi:hypothetical protein Raf01_63990 [Rugosimonospora africana]|uniref:Uncharacterized protein n=2 Tax=Rugosimonospora africana TaxID=556532 RepID=A0A8J3QY37_9ACTN|nr:hypothetical protein Raf01_63990 [Rugosimonospora africana]
MPPPVDPSPSAGPTGPTDPWGQLAARVATAQDKRYVARYTLTTRGRPVRTVTVTVAADGSWLVTVPGGALGGTADVAVADTPAGLYQCALGTTPGIAPGCVRVADPTGTLPAKNDPRVQYLFTSWLPILTDRDQAIAVNNATLKGAAGQCFSVEPNSAALTPPVDAGIYCYDADGTLTAAALALGTLTLTGAPAPAPPAITLPAPVVAGAPLPTTSPSPTTPASAGTQ